MPEHVPGRNIVLACGHPEGLATLHRGEVTAWCPVCAADVEVVKFSVGDLISYRPAHEGVEPHRAHVERVEDRGLIVLDEQPGMPLTHLVTWDRVIGRVDA